LILYGNTDAITMMETLFQLSLTALGVLSFFVFRSLVEEMRQVRQELHLLNIKIADLLAKDQVLEHRLSVLEQKK
jgi:hypothetical protein